MRPQYRAPPQSAPDSDSDFDTDPNQQMQRHATLLRTISSIIPPSQPRYDPVYEELMGPARADTVAPAVAPAATREDAPLSTVSTNGTRAADPFADLGPSPIPLPEVSSPETVAAAGWSAAPRGSLTDHQVPLLLRYPNANDDSSQYSAAGAVPGLPQPVQIATTSSFHVNPRFAAVLTFVLAVICVCIFVPLSFVAVERQHIAFIWHRTSTVDTSRVYTSGNWFVGLNRRAISFPSTLQYVNFTNQMLTFTASSGQVFSAEIAFHYKINPAGLEKIFRFYADAVNRRITSIARNAFTIAATNFVPSDFVTRRAEVASAFGDGLRAALLADGLLITVPTAGLFIGAVLLPNSIIFRNLEIFEQTQLQIQQAYELRASQIRLDTRVNVTAVSAQTSIILTTAALQRVRMNRVAQQIGVGELRAVMGTAIQQMITRLELQTVGAIEKLTLYTLLMATGRQSGAVTLASQPNVSIITPATIPVLPFITP